MRFSVGQLCSGGPLWPPSPPAADPFQEKLSEYAISEAIREILMQEQEHSIDLATALGIDVPAVPEI